jgi:hypothetical protein
MPPLPLLLLSPAAVAACTETAYLAGSLTLFYILLKVAWSRVPEWIREDVAIKNLKRKSAANNSSSLSNSAVDELSSLASVLEKLQALVVSGTEKLLIQPVPHLYASLLIYIQLAGQLRVQSPMKRDDWYMQSGQESDAACSDMDHDLQECLHYSIVAYEIERDTLQTNLGHDFDILQHNTLVADKIRPGFVGHFTAVDKQRKLVVVGIRGTSTLEDLLTDCCGRAVSYSEQQEYDTSSVEVQARQPNRVCAFDEGAIEIVSGHERICVHDLVGDNDIRCHEGILICATRLANVIQAAVQEYVCDNGYRLLLTGHSLGGGVASLTGVILRSRLAALAKSNLLRVVAFAPPPVLDHDSSVVASSYTTSVVNNSDLIPRASLVNVAVFLEFLCAVSVRLVERGLAPVDPASTIALFQKLTRNKGDELIMSLEETRSAMDAAHLKVELRNPDHLYIPGRVLILYEKWTDDASLGKIGEATGPAKRSHCILTDGSSPILRFIEIDALRMATDHVCASYTASIESQRRNTSPAGNLVQGQGSS